MGSQSGARSPRDRPGSSRANSRIEGPWLARVRSRANAVHARWPVEQDGLVGADGAEAGAEKVVVATDDSGTVCRSEPASGRIRRARPERAGGDRCASRTAGRHGGSGQLLYLLALDVGGGAALINPRGAGPACATSRRIGSTSEGPDAEAGSFPSPPRPSACSSKGQWPAIPRPVVCGRRLPAQEPRWAPCSQAARIPVRQEARHRTEDSLDHPPTALSPYPVERVHRLGGAEVAHPVAGLHRLVAENDQ